MYSNNLFLSLFFSSIPHFFCCIYKKISVILNFEGVIFIELNFCCTIFNFSVELVTFSLWVSHFYFFWRHCKSSYVTVYNTKIVTTNNNVKYKQQNAREALESKIRRAVVRAAKHTIISPNDCQQSTGMH